MSSPLLSFEEEVIKREVIEEEDNKIEARPLVSLFKKVIKGDVFEEEYDKTEARVGVLDAFLAVGYVKFGKERIARLGFKAYVTGLRTNDAEVDEMVFLTMVENMGLTFLIIGDNWTIDKMDEIFSNWIG